jgi:glycosyltransferase involved in cell wall biosynthesis
VPCSMSTANRVEASTGDDQLTASKSVIRILRLLKVTGRNYAPYNQFSVAAPARQQITLFTLCEDEEPIHARLRRVQADGSLRGFLRSLRSLLEGDEFDLVHVHSPHVALLFIAAKWLRLVRLPSVYTVHSSYHVYRFRKRLALLPILLSFDRVVCCSYASLDSFPWILKRIGGRRLVAIPNGVDIQRVDVATSNVKPQKSAEGFRVVAANRLIALKNTDSLIRAFASVAGSEWHLQIMGDGVMENAWKALASDLDIDHQAVFTGRVPRSTVYANLASADVFVSTSSGEGLPNAVMEAMTCRCPVILSDIPAHREIVGDNLDVPLIEPGDDAALARELKRFANMNATDRLALGRACRRIVEQKFNLPEMLRQYEDLFQNLVSQHPPDARGRQSIPATRK